MVADIFRYVLKHDHQWYKIPQLTVVEYASTNKSELKAREA